MSKVTILWTFGASACLTLAVVHFLVGVRQKAVANLLFVGTSLSAAAIAAFELAIMRATSPAEYGSLVRGIHVPIFTLVVSLVCFVRAYLRAGRIGLAIAAIAARGACLLVNFLHAPNFNFDAITGLHSMPFLGENVAVADGVVSAWTRLGQLANVLLLVFLIDATVAVWRRGERRRAAVVGGGSVVFLLAAAGHTSLVFAGLRQPFMISIAYVAIVAAMAYELTYDVVRAGELARELASKDRALRESDRRLALAAEAAHLAFWSWDVEADEVWMTPRGRTMRGFTGAELLDRDRLFAVVHEEDREGLRAAIDRAARERSDFDREYRIAPPGGDVRWISLRGSGRLDPQDGRVKVQGVSIDITSRKEAELDAKRRQAELAHLSRVTMLGELSGSLAHELNQPLTAILSNAQAAQRFLAAGRATTEDLQQILAEIVDADEHAGEVIRRLRRLLKKGEIEREPLDPAVLVEDVLKLLRSDLIARHVAVSSAIPGALPKVRGDGVQLQQVLVNLVTNACDAMDGRPPAERRLSLSIGPDGPGMLCLSVGDRGTGVPEGEADRLFQPFVTTKVHGMGLGLAVCRTIVSAHGGRLWATNNDGPGATFHFTLPTLEAG